MGKPTIKEIEEYMAALNLPDEVQEWPTDQTPESFYVSADKYLKNGLNGTTAYDIISKPRHYMLFDEMEVKERAFEGQGVEVRDVIEKLVLKVQGQSLQTVPHYTKEAALFESDYVQLMQYLMRFMDKNGKEDLEKARWYLDKMIQAY